MTCRHSEAELPRTLQRIAIRLHVVLGTGKTKLATAVHTVAASLTREKERLDTAQRDIDVRYLQ